MKNKIYRQLASYSGMTAAYLLTVPESDAQIVYTDINDVKISHSDNFYPFDLNNDGIYDYGLIYNNNEGIRILRMATSSSYPAPNNFGINDAYVPSGSYIGQLSSGEVIGPDLNFESLSSRFILVENGGSEYGEWDGGVSNGFIGLRFSIGNETHYGWARLAVERDAKFMILQDFAYNATAGASIVAGDEGCSSNFEPNDSKAQAAPIQPNILINASLTTANDIDWYTFAVAGAENNIQTVLSSLPFNYNVKLIDQNGNLIAKSLNQGTHNDIITYNNLAAGNYYVKVISSNGQFSVNECYSLIVQTSANPFRESITSSGDQTPELVVFPNPFTESALIQFSVDKSSVVEILLFNLQGMKIKTIAEGNFEQGNYQVNLQKENLNAGVYLLQWKSGDETATQKVVVE